VRPSEVDESSLYSNSTVSPHLALKQTVEIPAQPKALPIARQLADSDENNALWQRDVSVIYYDIGSALVATGKLDEALAAYRKSLVIPLSAVRNSPPIRIRPHSSQPRRRRAAQQGRAAAASSGAPAAAAPPDCCRRRRPLPLHHVSTEKVDKADAADSPSALCATARRSGLDPMARSAGAASSPPQPQKPNRNRDGDRSRDGDSESFPAL
jgi:hypothetical protein